MTFLDGTGLVFEHMSALAKEAETYLQQLVWHRLDKVGPLMSDTLAITCPEIAPLMKQILVRHDIVHRGGKTKDGKAIVIGAQELGAMRDTVTVFVNEIERQLQERSPVDTSGLVGEAEF